MVERLLSTDLDFANPNLAVVELGLRLIVDRVTVLVLLRLVGTQLPQNLKVGPAVLHHRHDFCNEVRPCVTHVLLALAEELCLGLSLGSIRMSIYEPGNATEKHFDAE